jgi:hypothetical protein
MTLDYQKSCVKMIYVRLFVDKVTIGCFFEIHGSEKAFQIIHLHLGGIIKWQNGFTYLKKETQI